MPLASLDLYKNVLCLELSLPRHVCSSLAHLLRVTAQVSPLLRDLFHLSLTPRHASPLTSVCFVVNPQHMLPYDIHFAYLFIVN